MRGGTTEEEKEEKEKAGNASLKTKTPHSDVRKNPHSDESCDFERRSINKKNHVTEIQ